VMAEIRSIQVACEQHFIVIVSLGRFNQPAGGVASHPLTQPSVTFA
jgi:hypothetical protein